MQALTILNLGCGSKTSPACINIDWSPYVRLRKHRVIAQLARHALRGERRVRFDALADRVVAHDLRKGIPAADASVDVVYHSHLLEHLDRDRVPGFLEEVRRVLRPGGIHRVVVPDLEILCRRYLADFHSAMDFADHDERIGAMIEQMVRREAAGTRSQPMPWRLFERTVRGDARRRGETHQWMYDRITLPGVLAAAGFVDPIVLAYDASHIPGWSELGLDVDTNGGEYKIDSLYVEARRP